ncbi:MAG: CapA family protein [Candidatus Pacebacteria bacterium]|nr:CapA family protein [Candidatus Paceibacterota bacterium]
MKLPNFTASLLLTVLTIQISSIHFSIKAGDFNFGLLSNKLAVEAAAQLESDKLQRLAYLESTPSSIVFVGDVLLARNVEHLMNRTSPSYPFQGISLRRAASDSYVFGNFESSIPEDHITTEVNKINFSVNKKFIPAAAKAGFTHFSLANNHSNDFGDDAFVNTTKVLSDSNIESFGHTRDFDINSVSFVSVKDAIVAVVGLHTLLNPPTQEEIDSVLSYAEAFSDFQIVYIHWGVEYNPESSTAQRGIAEQLVSSGADLIIGHHPHVVQEIGVIDGVPVFYSLGNYIFDQYFSQSVQEGLLLRLEFGESINIYLNPVTSTDNLSQPAYMKKDQRGKFLRNLASVSSSDILREIENGVLQLDTLVATSSKMAMINR